MTETKIGYWTDNGAYYYYNTIVNMTYEDSIKQIYHTSVQQEIPLKYFEVRIFCQKNLV